ncbi:MAG: hypothetical protein JXB24_14910 [Bacteroidales bacterium]|nr:hypothetical protein [Bacteroidales bacterium]
MLGVKDARKKNIPVTDYNISIAYVHGIFRWTVGSFIGKADKVVIL